MKINIEEVFKTQRLIDSLKNITNDMDITVFKAFICSLFCEYCAKNGMEYFQAIDDVCEAVREYNHPEEEEEEEDFVKIFGMEL